jgi:hypothetical protein
MPAKKKYPILRQPDDITCGPTALHSVYEYHSDAMDLDTVVREVPMLRGGGTLGALLGLHALRRGYDVEIYSYNLQVFDPTWFKPTSLGNDQLIEKLRLQMKAKRGKKLHVALQAYIEFLEAGGVIRFEDLTASLLSNFLLTGRPLLTGLSATYLYRAVREHGKYPKGDDIRGEPQGHFVVLTSFDAELNTVTVADPYHPESNDYGHVYRVNVEHLVNAILLGVVTYDGNLIVITKRQV